VFREVGDRLPAEGPHARLRFAPPARFGVSGFGFRVRVSGSGFRVPGFGFRVSDFGVNSRALGSRFGFWNSPWRVAGAGWVCSVFELRYGFRVSLRFGFRVSLRSEFGFHRGGARERAGFVPVSRFGVVFGVHHSLSFGISLWFGFRVSLRFGFRISLQFEFRVPLWFRFRV